MSYVFADRVKDLHGSAIREAFKALSKPGMISFAGGMPAVETYENVILAGIAENILKNHGRTALQYGITEGYAPLIEKIIKRLDKDGISVEGNTVITVTGAQQGVELLTKVLINSGDGVACENPSFIGSLNAFRSYGAKLYGVDMDEDGMNIEKLDKTLAENPDIKLIYTIPTFQNPTGRTMSLEKRKQLLLTAKKYNVMILEDNPYGELRFAGEPLPTIKSMDSENRVVYIGSFSKVVAPGLRVGFVCAESDLVEKMIVCKQVSDVHTNVLAQMMINEYIEKHDFDGHIAYCAELYGKKCAIMKNCINEYFPKSVSSTSPQGGIFLWCDMNNGVDSKLLAAKALESNVAIVAGASAMPDQTKVTSAFRLNYTADSDDRIVQGIKALGEVLYGFTK